MMTNLAELKARLLDATKNSASTALVTHRNPDGDGLPACLALQELLRLHGVDADFVLEHPCHELYEFLEGPARTRVYDDAMAYDCIILVDCHSQSRIGACAPLVDRAKHIFAIDHHHEQDVIPGATTYIDTEIVSAGAILWQLFHKDVAAQDGDVRRYLLDALYTTILNDTDNFVNANTDALTFDICRQMANLGLDAGPVARHFVWGKTAGEMRLVGEVLSAMKLELKGRVLFLHSTLEMLDRLQLDSESTSKLTRWVKGVRGVEAIVYFREIGPQSYRLSLRSNGADVNAIARSHGGGGHTRAAGCEMHGELADVQAEILVQLKEQL